MSQKQKRIDETWDRLMSECEKRQVKIVEKTTRFWKLIGSALSLIGNDEFVTGYVTTIGRTIAVPPGWLKRNTRTASGCGVIRHELVHVDQMLWCGLGSMRLGLPVFAFLYLLLPLPAGFAWFRWRFERSAYLIGDKLRADLLERPLSASDSDRLIWQLTGPGYGFAMLFAKKQCRKWAAENYGRPKD